MVFLSSRDITVRRGAHRVLTFPDLSVRRGERVFLSGASGAGKTTLLSVLSGLLPPGSGGVVFDGQDLYTLNGAARDRVRGQRIGFVFQTLYLLPTLTLRQNIALAANMAGQPLDRARLDALLDGLGLTYRADAMPAALSQGEQQRGAIARAVLNRPALILADEPTSALDNSNAAKVMELLFQHARENDAALLVASHDDRIKNDFDTSVLMESAQEGRAA